ncbi:SDR family NAD(P)-dependent oxidoreductase [Pandoraea fibrosis]|uniref:SDR family NAD(P)-dependent oxidoreductase n=1 Tax=Pandoraea fibrosis TaxID=1891094 RepID=A0ABX6HVJ2_9BURK|nr:SDR family NAD(P)-dependent oxidoreductase [Pandoraea fibrosis]QHE91549.1 SDR family NAD(P)-dependent oxidoreductase [Pandoraea fibrosis]QHF14893.1 SDR family NAD(P)-dependent oxidoreductase [Pandoraea fibrosis]
MQGQGTALVTGASRGLGRAISLELARRGYDVIACVRDLASANGLVEQAEHLSGTIRLQKLDMAALGEFRVPDNLRILINNAGYRGPYLPIEETSMDEWRRTFETNFFGLIDLTRRAIPALRNARDGIICNIGSMGAYMPMPFYTTYRASKLALTAISEGLRIELAPFGIRVIEIPIGGVDTDMLRTSIANRPPEAIDYERYRPMAEQHAAMPAQIRSRVISADDAARNVVDQLEVAGPLKRACDPNAQIQLAELSTSTEESRAQALFARFGAAPA